MRIKRPDNLLLLFSLALIIFGFAILSVVSASYSYEKYGSSTYFLFHQALAGLLPGFILGIIAFFLPLAFIKKMAPLALLASLILMVLVFVPHVGFTLGGATSWIGIGPLSFQPSEFLKVTFILYLAAWLGNKTEKTISRPKIKKLRLRTEKTGIMSRIWKHFSFNDLEYRSFIPFVVVVGIVSILLVCQRDVGTLGVIFLCAILMYFFANTPLWHSALMVLGGAGGLAFLIKIAPYRFDRILIFLNPDLDPMGKGYQVKQALIAIGSGGLFGLGWGMSRQKFGFLPHPMSDSIFAIFAEEAGFLGSLMLIGLYLAFLWQGFKIAKRTTDKFSQLSALGISCWILIQAFVNIGAMLRMSPLTGIPLPFVSYGGTALVAEMAALGVLLNISKSS